MSYLLELIKGQPVFAMGLVTAAISLLTAFGLNWTGVQIGAIQIFIAALLSFFLQKIVTPISNPTLAAGTVVNVQGTEDTTTVG